LTESSLAAFGGFLEEAWQGNDLTWGRLDAAEILLRKLLPADQWGTRGRTLLKRAQDEVTADMESRGMGISASAAKSRKDLIGEQTTAVIPFSRKAGWSGRAVLTLLKMVRKSLAESRAQFLARTFVSGLDYVIRVLTWLFLGTTFIAGLFRRSRVLGYVIAVLAIMAVGVMLWEQSLCWWVRWLVPSLDCRVPR
jgi:hypothetical protein